MEVSLGLCVCLLLASTQAADWSYKGDKGPDNWHTHDASCGGMKQSPINIVTSEVTEDTSLGSITMNAQYNSIPIGTWQINNNGHSVGVAANTGDYMISQGGLGANYKLAQFHFHWGAANWQGSEHTINGKKYPLEIHMVHYNSKYATVGEALNKTDGLAVLGFVYEIDDSDNNALKPVVDKLTEVVDADSKVNIDPINLMDIMGGEEGLDEFYRYQGSLTTPGCYESVTWTVFNKVLKISNAQMAKFRSVKDSHADPLVDNFRPVLPLHGRTVYASHMGGSSSASTFSVSAVFAFTCLTLALAKLYS